MGSAPSVLLLVIHDELGQVRGERSGLYDALETAMGAQAEPMSLVISTQAPTAIDLLSRLIDDAKTKADPQQKLILFEADNDDDIEALSQLVPSEDLAGQALRSVPICRRAQLARGRHAEACHQSAVRHHEHRHVASLDP